MSSPFVIFRVEKLKTLGEIVASLSHQHRQRQTDNADPSRLNKNIVLVSPPRAGEIMNTIRAKLGGKVPAKNAVLASDILISASPEYFRPNNLNQIGYYDLDRLNKWREKVEPWIKENFPDALSVVIHLDEATPHIAILDCPINHKTGRLSHREKFGGDNRRDGLRAWQTKAADCVASLGIVRGISGSTATHTDIKKYYASVSSPAAEIPKVKTARATPLPEATLLEKIPFSKAQVERKELEVRAEAIQLQRDAEIKKRNETVLKHYPILAQKAKAVDMLTKQNNELQNTLVKKDAELAASKEQANKLRALPLHDVLVSIYGAIETKDSKPAYASRKFDLADGRQFAVTDDKWIEQGGKGGKGAINLAMHIDNLEYKPALRLLAESFDTTSIVAEHSRNLLRQSTSEVEAIKKEPLPPPKPNAQFWPRVNGWLNRIRGIPNRLIDRLYKLGLVYADLQGNAVFPRQGGGAFVRGTGTQPFKRTYGNADAGVFAIPGKADESGIYLVEGAVDAIAIKAMLPNAVAIATGGNLLSMTKLKEMLQVPSLIGGQIFAAFDNDKQGEEMSLNASRILNAIRFAPPQPCKDWAEAVKENPSLISSIWMDSIVSRPKLRIRDKLPSKLKNQM